MQDIAQDLRRRREELGKSLEDVQAATKIRLRYLQALEAGEPEQIPGEVYAKGFLRSYGDFLGLDGWALVERYKAWRREVAGDAQAEPIRSEAEGDGAPVPRIAPRAYALFQRPRRSGQQVRSGRLDLAMRVGTGVLILAVGVTIWALRQGPVRQDRQPTTSPAPASNDTPSAPVTPAPPFGDQAAGDAAQDKPLPTVETTRNGRSASYTVKGADALRVQADLTGDCWVRVVADGQEVFSGTLHAGDQRTWEARQHLEIQAGLPASLRLKVNDVAVDPFDSTDPMNLSFQIGS